MRQIKKSKSRKNNLMYGIPDFYEEYKYQCRMKYGKSYMDMILPGKIWRNVAYDYFDMLADMILETRKSFRMPHCLGALYLQKLNTSNLVPKNYEIKDPEARRKCVTYLQHYIYEGECYIWKSVSSRYTKKSDNMYLYSFIPARRLKKKLYNHMYDCVIDPKKKKFDFEPSKKRAPKIKLPPV